MAAARPSGICDAGELPPEGVILKAKVKPIAAIPVLTGWSSRSDTEAEAALIALNRTTELGGWDNEALLSALDETIHQHWRPRWGRV